MSPALSTRLVIDAAVLLVLVLPALHNRSGALWSAMGSAAFLVGAVHVDAPQASAGLIAVAVLVEASRAWRHSAASAVLTLAGACAVAAIGILTARGALQPAFLLSIAVLAVRAGAVPFHLGAANLAERAPAEQARQLAATVALVLFHLTYLDHDPLAARLAPLIVRFGAVAACLAAVTTLGATDVRGFFRGSVLVHGGMLVAALGACGRGHFGAALFAILAMALAQTGLAVVIDALEHRFGVVDFRSAGGRVRRAPLLAGAFAFFGAASVGMPGTAGFIADDLLLHALWEESVAATAGVTLAAALLAIATLWTLARVFMGPGADGPPRDLALSKRIGLSVLALALLALGIWPAGLLHPATLLFGAP